MLVSAKSMGNGSERTFQIKLNFCKQLPLIFLISNSQKLFLHFAAAFNSLRWKVFSLANWWQHQLFSFFFDGIMIWLLFSLLQLLSFQGFTTCNPLETYPPFPFWNLFLKNRSANDGNLHINRLNAMITKRRPHQSEQFDRPNEVFFVFIFEYLVIYWYQDEMQSW